MSFCCKGCGISPPSLTLTTPLWCVLGEHQKTHWQWSLGEVSRWRCLTRGRETTSSKSHRGRSGLGIMAASPTAIAERIRQPNGQRVKAIFFDLDDTLVLTHEADSLAHSAVMALLAVRAPNVNVAAVLVDFLKGFNSEAWDPEHKVDVTEWRARLWGKALEREGVNDMDLARDLQSCFDKERMLAFRWTSKVESLVRSLHFQGIKVGIITNGHPKVQRAKLNACKANELFNIILVGGEEPNPKPHRDIFLKACHQAGCSPEEAIMVGDTLKTDIQGGINAGFLSTVWVNVHKVEPPLGAAKPDYEIATFSELQQVLGHFGVLFDACQ